jgi:hypothetical protein
LRSFSSAEAVMPFLKKQHDHFSNVSTLRPPFEERELLQTVDTIYQFLKQLRDWQKAINLGQKRKQKQETSRM